MINMQISPFYSAAIPIISIDQLKVSTTHWYYQGTVPPLQWYWGSHGGFYSISGTLLRGGRGSAATASDTSSSSPTLPMMVTTGIKPRSKLLVHLCCRSTDLGLSIWYSSNCIGITFIIVIQPARWEHLGCYWQTVPPQWEGGRLFEPSAGFFYGNSCNSGSKSRKIVSKVGN